MANIAIIHGAKKNMNEQQISQIESLEQLIAWMLSQRKNPIKDAIREDLIQAKKYFHKAISKALEES